jgi:uncharacterized protein
MHTEEKLKKKFIPALILCLAIMLPFTTVFGADVVTPTDDFYVADYAEVIDSDTETYIVEMNESLYEQTGAQVVVVTVDFLDGIEIEDYAYTLFNDWGIGSADKNNGVLILLAIGEENYWAMQGTGLESVLTSRELGDMLYDYLEDDFASGDYDTGTKKVFDAVVDELADYYNVTVSADSATNNGISGGIVTDNTDNTTNENTQDTKGGFPIMGGILIFLFILFVIIIIAAGRSRGGGGRYYNNRTRRYDRDPHHPPMPGHRDNGPDDDPFGGFGGGTPHSPSSHSSGPSRNIFGSGGSSRGGGSGRSGGGFSGGSGGGNSHSGGSSHSGGGGSSRGGGAGRR